MFKIFAVGNILMRDDGIALSVLKDIQDDLLRIHNDIQVIQCETDYMYCLDMINEDDIIIIVDGAIMGNNPGTVSQISNTEIMKNSITSQHQLSLPIVLNIHNIKDKYYLILIEVYDVDYGEGLSSILLSKYRKICEDVLKEIENIVKSEVKKDA